MSINLIANYVYILPFFMFLIGLYIIIINKNLLIKILGLNIFQGGIIVFYVLTGKINNSVAPIVDVNNPHQLLSNPLPHVLMLTAIVVGIATTALACAFIYKIYEHYKTINEEEIQHINKQSN